LYFATAGTGSNTDRVLFADGDVTTPIAATLPTLSALIGRGAPALDITYEIPVAVGDPADGAEGVSLLRSGPNPFARGTTLHFTLARAGETTLSIYDVAGRRVVTLVDGMVPAGWHGITWDGRTGSGRSLPAGVYWARLLCNGQVRSEQLVRLEP
jgi:hypothetical protein